ERRDHDHEALRQRAAGQHARLVRAAGRRRAGVRRRLAGPVPTGLVYPAHAFFAVAERVAVGQSLGLAFEHTVHTAVAVTLGPAEPLAPALSPALTIPVADGETVAMGTSQELPFLDSV